MTNKSNVPMTESMFYVLLALRRRLHGYAIMEEVQVVSNGRLEMGPGTLYGILKRLQKDNLISLEKSDGRRKIYNLTEKGHQALRQEYLRLCKMVDDGKVMDETGEKDGKN